MDISLTLSYTSQAMEECGADEGPIRVFLGELRGGRHLGEALTRPALPPGVAAFVGTTMAIAESAQVHRIAAFAYGREEIIPQCFSV